MSEDKSCNSCRRHNDGIRCDVKNCHYHSGECYCTADRIAVGPTSAQTSADTVCATFKPKTE